MRLSFSLLVVIANNGSWDVVVVWLSALGISLRTVHCKVEIFLYPLIDWLTTIVNEKHGDGSEMSKVGT